MNKKSLAINAANLHSGGGVQVATSFIYEVSRLPEAAELAVFASSEVNENLLALGARHDVFNEYHVVDVHGLRQLTSTLRGELNRFDVVFTVFGPLYMLNRKFHSIVGFAQPWIIYPDNEVYAGMPLMAKFRERSKFHIQKLFFAMADSLVVELEHVRDRLKEIGVRNRVSVVYNCLSQIYRGLLPGTIEGGEQDVLAARKGSVPDRRISLGIITRDYPHKNLDILPHVKFVLDRRYHIDADIYVTLNEKEWSARSESFRQHVINIGALRVIDCPDFYRKMDAIIFPSFLECFSASPLEAMAMGKPLFASDRGFVRDVCGGHAFYFDPQDPDDIADVIQRYFFGDLNGTLDLAAARQHALEFSCSESRARHYLDIMLQV